MGEVIPLKRPKRVTIKGSARSVLTDAFAAVAKPSAVVIVVLGADGTYALRSARLDEVAGFDMYSRAGAIMDRQRMELLD